MPPLRIFWRLLRRFPGLCGLAALLLACGASGALVQLSDLRRDPSFDLRALAAGGLAVLGFEATPPDLPELERDRCLDYPLFAALEAGQPAVPLTGAKTVRQRLQLAGVDTRVHQLLAGGMIAELPFDALRAALPERRFLLSAKLESNEVIETSARAEDAVTYCTTRSIAVRYRIVDLVAQHTAWQGVLRESDQDCNESTRRNRSGDTEAGRGRLLAALITDLVSNALTDVILGTHPEPPPLRPLTDAAAHDLASVLSGATKRKTAASSVRARKSLSGKQVGVRAQ